MDAPAAMDSLRIGERVIYDGRAYVVEGVDPMSVPERRVYLRAENSGKTLIVPLVAHSARTARGGSRGTRRMIEPAATLTRTRAP